MYEPAQFVGVSEPSTAQGKRLRPVRRGRFADAAGAVAWIAGAAATVLHPAGVLVAGLLLGVVATSVARAVAAGASFGIVVVAAGAVWLAVTGSPPPTQGVDPALLLVAALLGPPTVAATVRALG